MQLRRPTLLLAMSIAALLSSCAQLAAPRAALVEINLVALNDFHGALEAHDQVYSQAGQTRATARPTMRLGGVDTIAGAIRDWRREDPQLLVVGAGDLVGASPAMSAMYADEPAIEALNLIGLRISALGNHEFDRGTAELLRQQSGGCVGASGAPAGERVCKWRNEFGGAQFTYLAANVRLAANDSLFMPAWKIETIKGVRIGFIGAVVRDTQHRLSPRLVGHLQFGDEADAINRAAAELRKEQVDATVVLIHQGVTAVELAQVACNDFNHPIAAIVRRLDPEIRLVITGHSHSLYHCEIDGRTVTQAEAYGNYLTRIRLQVDPTSHTVVKIDAHNVAMDPSKFAPDPRLSALLAETKAGSFARLSQIVAHTSTPHIPKEINRHGESILGTLVADSQLAATKALGAHIVFMNDKSVRNSLLSGPEGVSYAQMAASLPYNNTLILMELSGAQIRQALEQQSWLRSELAGDPLMLQVSEGLRYQWDGRRPRGARVIPESLTLNGLAIEDAKLYRVCVNSYLAEGGDGFAMFTQGLARQDTGISDLQAAIDYLAVFARAGKALGPTQAPGRVQRID